MARVSTPFSEKLGLRLPLIAAPMAGGPTTPELVAACSAAGALGALGFAYTQPDDMKKQAAFVRSKTERPFSIDLRVSMPSEPIDPGAQRAALAAVAKYYAELGLPAPEPVRTPYAPEFDAQITAVQEIRPRVFTTHLGCLPKDRVDAIRSRGIVVGGTATCIAEAKLLEKSGYDFVIAQGGEAGGHRGTYLRDSGDALTGTLALARAIVRAVQLPVVAAGGIMDGAGIAATLALGAQLAQLGTAFVSCPESGAAQIHKDLVLQATEDNTRVTEKFSGKPARGLANRFMKEMQGAPQLAFPAQNSVTGKLRQASAKAGKPDFVALWSGQAAPLARSLPA
ncbi:MAG TPA: nitronate monooxygenase, partial [Burkholderiales bacterium]|nr:nitronate monooxygenase [Burkholderiales bacterium]